MYVILRVTQQQPFPHTVDDLDGKRSLARSAVIYECTMETHKFGDNEGSCGRVVNTHTLRPRRRSTLKNDNVRRFSGYDHGVYEGCLYIFNSRIID